MARQKWTIEIEVDDTWVADGFDMDDERAHIMLHEHLPWARDHELEARVTKAPNPNVIRKLQGYPVEESV